jgi:hypothetical protein
MNIRSKLSMYHGKKNGVRGKIYTTFEGRMPFILEKSSALIVRFT